MLTMRKIAIFASGSGTNAERIIKYFANTNTASVLLILSNKKDAYVLQRAKNLNVKFMTFDKEKFNNADEIINILKDLKIDLIVLAGFLLLLPKKILNAFPNRIVNIHPALLPKYGGKGMYGMNVHKAVIENNEKETGITIHYVNGKYDEGAIIYQAKCKIETNDTPEIIAEKIHLLEHQFYPNIIEKIINELK